MSTATEPPVTPEQITSPWYLLEGSSGTSILTRGPELQRMVDALGPDRSRQARDGRIALWHPRGGVSYYRAVTEEEAASRMEANRRVLEARQELGRAVEACLGSHGLLYSYDRIWQTLTEGAEVYAGGTGVRVWHRDKAWLQARDPRLTDRDARRAAVTAYRDVLGIYGADSEVVGSDLHVHSFPVPSELAAVLRAERVDDNEWEVHAGGSVHTVLRAGGVHSVRGRGTGHGTLALALLEVAGLSGALVHDRVTALRKQLSESGGPGLLT